MTEDNAEKIARYVEAIGDEVVNRASFEHEGEEYEILVCLSGSNEYRIDPNPEKPYYKILFRFDLFRIIASVLDQEIVEDLTGVSVEGMPVRSVDIEDIEENNVEMIIEEEEDELTPPIKAAEKMVKTIDEGVLDRFRFNLFQELSDPSVSTSINYHGGVMRGFTIGRKIFPEDEGFCLTEFNRSVQSVHSIGTFGHNFTTEILSEIDWPKEMDEIDT